MRKTNRDGKAARSSEERFASEKALVPTQKRSRFVRADPPDIALTLKHFNGRVEKSGESKRLYLRVGDEVNHLRHEEWGIGVVVEAMTSSIPGGTCLARVRFQDGQLRCFNNDLDNEACCYYFGVRRYWNPTHGVDTLRSKFFMRG